MCPQPCVPQNLPKLTKIYRNGTDHQKSVCLEECHLVSSHKAPTCHHHVNRLGELVIGDRCHQGAPQQHLLHTRSGQGQVVHQLVPYVPGEVVAGVRHCNAGHDYGLKELGGINGVDLPIEGLVRLKVHKAGTLSGRRCCYGNHRGSSWLGTRGEEGGLGGYCGIRHNIGEDEVDAGVGGLQGGEEEGGGGVVSRCRGKERTCCEQLHHGRDWGPQLRYESERKKCEKKQNWPHGWTYIISIGSQTTTVHVSNTIVLFLFIGF